MTAAAVSVVVYRHRNGEDVSVFTSAEAARRGAAKIVADVLHEVPDLAVRQAILGHLSAERFDDALEAWHDAQNDHERIEISDDVVVQASDAPVVLAPMCPKCGNADTSAMCVRESYHAYHPVDGVGVERNSTVLAIQNALSVTCPSEHFDDGSSDYMGYCLKCLHLGAPESFGFGDASEWEWV